MYHMWWICENFPIWVLTVLKGKQQYQLAPTDTSMPNAHTFARDGAAAELDEWTGMDDI